MDKNRYPFRKPLVNVGDKFGLLNITFISRKVTKGDKIRTFCKCLCDCGREIETLYYSLKTNETTSCGCISAQKNALFHRKEIGEASFNSYERRYKNCAKHKKIPIEYSLTREDFKNLVYNNCHYCNTGPQRFNPYFHKDGITLKFFKGQKRSAVSQEWAEKQTIFVNGIDRIDSLKGYTIDNVLTCCSKCNYAKRGMSYNEFLEYLDKLILYRTSLSKEKITG